LFPIDAYDIRNAVVLFRSMTRDELATTLALSSTRVRAVLCSARYFW